MATPEFKNDDKTPLVPMFGHLAAGEFFEFQGEMNLKLDIGTRFTFPRQKVLAMSPMQHVTPRDVTIHHRRPQ